MHFEIFDKVVTIKFDQNRFEQVLFNGFVELELSTAVKCALFLELRCSATDYK